MEPQEEEKIVEFSPTDISYDIEDNNLFKSNFSIVSFGRVKEKMVAVKTLVVKHSELFTHEVKILTQLQSNTQLFIKLLGTIPSSYSIVMEYMPFTLHNLLSEIAPPWSTRLGISLNIAKGIEYLHKQNIVHCDIKAENILFDEKKDNPKLIDFGSAVELPPNENVIYVDKLKGTYYYMDPEHFRGTVGHKVTYSMDIFSLSIILYHLHDHKIISNKDESYDMRRLVAHLNGRRDTISDNCPPRFSKLIKKCWHERSDNRPSAGEVVDDLEQQILEQKKI